MLKSKIAEFEKQELEIRRWTSRLWDMAAFIHRKSIIHAEYDILQGAIKDCRTILDNIQKAASSDYTPSDNGDAYFDKLRESNERYYGDMPSAPNEKKGSK